MHLWMVLPSSSDVVGQYFQAIFFFHLTFYNNGVFCLKSLATICSISSLFSFIMMTSCCLRLSLFVPLSFVFLLLDNLWRYKTCFLLSTTWSLLHFHKSSAAQYSISFIYQISKSLIRIPPVESIDLKSTYQCRLYKKFPVAFFQQ